MVLLKINVMLICNNLTLETIQMSINRGMDRQIYIHTLEYYSVIKRNKLLTHTTIQMNLRNILGKRNQGRKRLYCTIPCL